MSGDTGSPGGDDPFDGLVLDETFVLGARKVEGSAGERAAAAERSRAAHLDLESRRAAEVAAVRTHERRGRRRRRSRWVIGTVTVVALLVGGGLWVSAHPEATFSSGTDLSDVVVARTHAGNRPSPQPAVSEVPLGTPAPTDGAKGPHLFMADGPDGRPAAYDPCRPIAVVLNNRTAPAGSDALVDGALAEASRRTGLQFVREGTTDEVPNNAREAYQPERYGDRWAPVLIAWSDPVEYASLGTDVAGLGGSTQIDVEGHAVFVSGQIALDGPGFADDETGDIRAVILHELGHLVGLDHVSDPDQLMHNDNLGQLEYGDGDIEGLAELGTGACVTRL